MNRIIKGSVIFLFLFSLISCTRLSKKDLEDKLLNNSFLLVNSRKDTLKVEFTSDGVINYSWGYVLFNEWCVKEIDNSLYLKIDFVEFKLKDYNENVFCFSRDNIGFELIKKTQMIVNKKLLVGTWVKEDDLLFNSSYNLCPNNNRFQMPNVVFNCDSCIFNSDCTRKKRCYSVNEVFGFIVFGNEPSLISDQWEIISINADTMLVNQRFNEYSEVKYKDNVKLIRVH